MDALAKKVELLDPVHHHDQLPLWLRGELAPIVTAWEELTREDRSFTQQLE